MSSSSNPTLRNWSSIPTFSGTNKSLSLRPKSVSKSSRSSRLARSSPMSSMVSLRTSDPLSFSRPPRTRTLTVLWLSSPRRTVDGRCTTMSSLCPVVKAWGTSCVSLSGEWSLICSLVWFLVYVSGRRIVDALVICQLSGISTKQGEAEENERLG